MMVCLWCESLDDRWCAGGIEDPERKDPDGSAGLFGLMVDPPPDAFQRWAEDCDEVPASLEGCVMSMYFVRSPSRWYPC